MVERHAFCQYLRDFLQVKLFTNDFCPNGLQVEGKEEISTFVTAVSASLSTIEAAVDAGADALVVHHGLFWKGDDPSIRGSKKRKLQLLLDHEISLYGFHLPLDAHPEVGNNWKAARDLGWANLSPFGEANGTMIGVKGYFPEVSIQNFVSHLEGYYEHNAHVALGGKNTIRSAALISGGGHKSILQAVKEGVDCFITGSFDEPIWHIAHEEGIHFIALGHAATEKIGPQALGDHLGHRFGIPHTFLDLPNPF
jgi:dinuclear metal center YbgI/SA1388 family protein